MTDYYEDDQEFDDDDDEYYVRSSRYTTGYDSDSFDEASVDSNEYYRAPTPASPPRRMTSVAEEEEPPYQTPKFLVLRGFGEEPVEVPSEKVVEAVAAPPKPTFSWGVPAASRPAPVDLMRIVSEQESEIEEAVKRREQQQQQREGNRRPPPPRGGSNLTRQSHDRLLLNPHRRNDTRRPEGGHFLSGGAEAFRSPTGDARRGDRRRSDTTEGDPRRSGHGGRRGEGGEARRVSGPRRGDTGREADAGRRVDTRSDLLCIHPARHNPHCKLPHSFEEWAPKLCKYGHGCSRKDQCSFWHTEKESKEQYLTRALRLDIVFFRKNKSQYIRTYKITI